MSNSLALSSEQSTLQHSLNRMISHIEMLRATIDAGKAAVLGASRAREHTDGRTTWETIVQLLSNEREQRIAFLLFHCGLTPAEIVQRCPQEFSDMEEVSRLRYRVMERFLQDVDSIS